MVFLALEGSATYAIDLAVTALELPDHQPDASEILSAILVDGYDLWHDGAIVAGRLVNADSALLLNPAEGTVTMYRPRTSGDKPIGKWSFADWPAVARPASTPGNREEWEAAYLKGQAFVGLMDPTYPAIWDEMRESEEAVFAARKAVKAAMRTRLNVVTT